MMNAEPTVRLARTQDVQPLTGLLNEAAAYKLQVHGDIGWQSGFQVAEVEDFISEGKTFVAIRDEALVGTIALYETDVSIWGERPDDALYVHRLAAKRQQPSSGIGARLIEWAAAQAISRHRQFLRLDCHPSSQKLCHYYENLGFIKIGERQTALPFIYTAALYEKAVKA